MPRHSPPFYRAFQEVVRQGTRPAADITLVTPVIGLSKAEIVRRGHELGTPFHLTWSCYREEAVACGRCDSCVLRLRGFAAAELTDPLRYAPDAPAAQDAPGTQDVPAARRRTPLKRERQVAALTAFLDRVRRS